MVDFVDEMILNEEERELFGVAEEQKRELYKAYNEAWVEMIMTIGREFERKFLKELSSLVRRFLREGCDPLFCAEDKAFVGRLCYRAIKLYNKRGDSSGAIIWFKKWINQYLGFKFFEEAV